MERLEDDAFRRGGSVPLDYVLKVCERLELDLAEGLEVRARLSAAEVVIEGGEGDDSQAVPGTETAERGPTERDLASASGYLREAAQFELMSAEEEVATMRRIRAGEAAAAERAKPGFTDPQLDLMVQSGQKARKEFLERNLRLVVWLANKLKRGSHLPFEDLIQEGNLGLMRAIDKWDHTRGLRFSTYATWWIYQGIMRALANQNRLVRVPVHMQERASKVRRVQKALTRERDGRPPTVHEIAEHLGWPAQRVQFLLDINREPVSIDAPSKEDDTSRIGDTIKDEVALDPEQLASASELSRDLERVLGQLSAREADILRRRFKQEDTLEAIGEDHDVTRERIRQIEAKALKRLRHPVYAKRLAKHLDESDD